MSFKLNLENLEPAYIDKNLALVNECRRGNRKAQFEIYKLYAKAMYNVALRIVNLEAEAEDVLQDAFLLLPSHESMGSRAMRPSDYGLSRS